MSEICSLASADKLLAFYVPGFLVIRAEGIQLPNPCYKARIKQSPLTIFPPQYVLLQCIEAGTICIQPLGPKVDIFGIFPIGSDPGRSITVHTAKGLENVPVTHVPLPNSAEESGSGGLPSPFALAGVPGLFSLGTGKKGAKARALVKVEATGYSFSDPLSFDEAFADAVQNLPPSGIPDWQDVIHVDDVGAIIGGFAGERKMYVKIHTLRPS